jgi:hypothetical protein
LLVSTGVGKSGDFFIDGAWQTASDKLPMARRYQDKYRLGYRDLLSIIWSRVTDSDVQNAAAILRKEGIYFYRKYKISEDAWVAQHGPDSVEDYTGSHFVKKKVTSREEFLRSYADEQPTDVVLRVNVGRLVRELREKVDLEPDDVVYRHGGTNNSIGGASARGFYVAQLRPGQLILEGMSPPVGLGICVGDGSYQRQVIAGKMSIYGIRAPSGKPKFTISLDKKGIEQVKGAANRLPGFDPGSGEFKGEAGVDDVRVVVEFLMVFLGMKPKNETFKGDERNDNLKPGLLAMQRVGIDPFSPPVKGQTWERAQKEQQARLDALQALRNDYTLRNEYIELRVAHEIEREPLPDSEQVTRGMALRGEFPPGPEQRAYQALLNTGYWSDEAQLRAENVVMRMLEGLPPPPPPPPPARRQNPDPLASYSDPEVAALALAAYERPMGGMWTYEDEEEE